MIKLKDLLTEGKISSDVEKMARKVGVKFDKKTKSITTNKYSNPKGDISKFGKDTDDVKVNSWFAKGDDVDKEQWFRIQLVGGSTLAEGPFKFEKDPVYDKAQTEDACMWFDQELKRYFMVCHVMGKRDLALFYSDNGKENVVSCETVDEFMNVLNFVRDKVEEERVFYSDPL